METLEAGTEIHYTGDVANPGGFGVVRTVIVDSKWGYTTYIIRMEDGTVRNVEASGFAEGPSRRFMTRAEYEAKRAARIAEMRAEAEARRAKG